MCGGGGSVSPTVTETPLAPVVLAPIDADESSLEASNLEKKRRRAAQGQSDTVLTSGLGVEGTAQTGGKKVLGE